MSVHNLCIVGCGVLCVGGVEGEYPAATLEAWLTLEVGLKVLAFGTLCLVHQFVLALTVFETDEIFLICQIECGHADHELGNISLSCQVGFGLVGQVSGDIFLLNCVELDLVAFDLDKTHLVHLFALDLLAFDFHGILSLLLVVLGLEVPGSEHFPVAGGL